MNSYSTNVQVNRSPYKQSIAQMVRPMVTFQHRPIPVLPNHISWDEDKNQGCV